MAAVTVLIPAYRSGPLLAATISSVLRQTFQDFTVRIAFDSPISDDLPHIEPLLEDKRLKLVQNERILGWDGNFRALIESVDSEFYLLLPHDDLISRDYLDVMIAALEEDPRRTSAYSDFFIFDGKQAAAMKRMEIPQNGNLFEQLFAFFLQGGEAVPMKGVVRRSLVEGYPFPVDGFGGFASECEGALRLILQGPVFRIPKPLYKKRIYPRDHVSTARGRWINMDYASLRKAWRGHAERMEEMLAGADVQHDEKKLLIASLRAQQLFRLAQAFNSKGGREHFAPILELEEPPLSSSVAALVESCGQAEEKRRMVLSRLFSARAFAANCLGKRDEALLHAERAVAYDAANSQALQISAILLFSLGRHEESLIRAAALARVSPCHVGLQNLLGNLSRSLAS